MDACRYVAVPPLGASSIVVMSTTFTDSVVVTGVSGETQPLGFMSQRQTTYDRRSLADAGIAVIHVGNVVLRYILLADVYARHPVPTR